MPYAEEVLPGLWTLAGPGQVRDLQLGCEVDSSSCTPRGDARKSQ